MTTYIGRREFITVLGGAATAWPLAARAQRAGKRYTVGILSAGDDPAALVGDWVQEHQPLPAPNARMSQSMNTRTRGDSCRFGG
jgi:hypothetical protein